MQKGPLPQKIPPPRNPRGFLRGLFAESRLSASLITKGGSLSRPPRPAVLPQSGKTPHRAKRAVHAAAFCKLQKIRGTAGFGWRPFPLYSLHPPPKVLEGWGPGGGKPFSKGFPPPQELPSPAGTSLPRRIQPSQKTYAFRIAAAKRTPRKAASRAMGSTPASASSSETGPGTIGKMEVIPCW